MRSEEVVHYARHMQREERSQVVHIPVSLQGRRDSDNRITRTALVKGSCTVRSLCLPLASKPAAFGIVTSDGRRSAVVCKRDDDSWEAVEAEPKRSNQCPQAVLQRGGNP